VQLELQNFEKAMADFQAAARHNPQDFRAYFMQGSVYEHYQDYASARQMYEKVLALNPNFTDARRALQELPRP
jgi:tetratricopeptide (TPR) repeat protein